MSAILGRVNFDGEPIDRPQAEHAFATLAVYGDGPSGLRVEGDVTLGQHTLALTPESLLESAPTRYGNTIVVADARLDDRDALCSRLGLPRDAWHATPDGVLIARAFEAWGERCTEHLLGDFAFAVWSPAPRRLFCARDHIGARPLYFHATPHSVSFATDPRALECFADIDRSIDEEAVARYLRWLVPARGTFYRAIRMLQPGQQLLADGQTLDLRMHWTPQSAADVRYRNRPQYAERFRELLEAAVADRVRTTAPVGAHLSGGLDSSGIAALTHRELRKRGTGLDQAYAWTPAVCDAYPPVPQDERALIEQVCRQEGIEWSGPLATGQEFRDSLARDMAAEGAADLFEELPVMRHAASRGIRVMLSGWGGDEAATYPGNGYPAHLLKNGRWGRLFDLVRRETSSLRGLRPSLSYLYRAAVVPLLPDRLYARACPDAFAYGSLDFLTDSQRQRYPGLAFERPALWREVGDPTVRQAMLLSYGHIAQRMETWAHWSAGHRMVYAYPLTDRRVIEFVLGLPPDLLYRDGHWRDLFRTAMQDVLPPDLNWKRQKSDPVNEAKRQDLRLACWRLLAGESRAGRWDGQDSDWLDVGRLRSEAGAVPDAMRDADIGRFAALRAAVRVWHLWQGRGGPAN